MRLFPGHDALAVRARRGAQLDLGVEPGRAGPGHEREQLRPDLARPAPRGAVCRGAPAASPARPVRRRGQVGQAGGDPGPLRTALQLRGQRQRGLADRDAVERRAPARRPWPRRSAALIASQFCLTSSAPDTLTSPNTCGCLRISLAAIPPATSSML